MTEIEAWLKAYIAGLKCDVWENVSLSDRNVRTMINAAAMMADRALEKYRESKTMKKETAIDFSFDDLREAMLETLNVRVAEGS